MKDLPNEGRAFLEEYSRQAVEYFARLEEDEYATLLKRVETLHEWMSSARTLRKKLIRPASSSQKRK